MTDTTNEKPLRKQPTHLVYHVNPADRKVDWKPIGKGWANSDGRGVNVQLDDGIRFIVRMPKGK